MSVLVKKYNLWRQCQKDGDGDSLWLPEAMSLPRRNKNKFFKEELENKNGGPLELFCSDLLCRIT